MSELMTLAAIEDRYPAAAREAMRMHMIAAGDETDLPSLKTKKLTK